jgi:metal-responsive CopG/Arc/MetJ family transcriptional regulator
MKIQIEFPDKMAKALDFYKINNDFKTKAEAVTDLAIKQLEPEHRTFVKDNSVENDKPNYMEKID